MGIIVALGAIGGGVDPRVPENSRQHLDWKDLIVKSTAEPKRLSPWHPIEFPDPLAGFQPPALFDNAALESKTLVARGNQR
jgi:hypothetical protein